jgi:hypothetical protein
MCHGFFASIAEAHCVKKGRGLVWYGLLPGPVKKGGGRVEAYPSSFNTRYM